MQRDVSQQARIWPLRRRGKSVEDFLVQLVVPFVFKMLFCHELCKISCISCAPSCRSNLCTQNMVRYARKKATSRFQTASLHPSSFIGDRFLLTAAHAARTKTKRRKTLSFGAIGTRQRERQRDKPFLRSLDRLFSHQIFPRFRRPSLYLSLLYSTHAKRP